MKGDGVDTLPDQRGDPTLLLVGCSQKDTKMHARIHSLFRLGEKKKDDENSLRPWPRLSVNPVRTHSQDFWSFRPERMI